MLLPPGPFRFFATTFVKVSKSCIAWLACTPLNFILFLKILKCVIIWILSLKSLYLSLALSIFTTTQLFCNSHAGKEASEEAVEGAMTYDREQTDQALVGSATTSNTKSGSVARSQRFPTSPDRGSREKGLRSRREGYKLF